MDSKHLSAARPILARLSLARRLAFAVAAFVASATLLGGELRLFELQAGDAALARAKSPAGATTAAVSKGTTRRTAA